MTQDEFSALPDGAILELATDVQNPSADRRQRHDWRAETTIRAGSRFRKVVSKWHAEPEVKLHELGPIDGWTHQRVNPGREMFSAMLPFLRSVTPTTHERLTVAGLSAHGAMALLEHLIDHGAVALETVLAEHRMQEEKGE